MSNKNIADNDELLRNVVEDVLDNESSRIIPVNYPSYLGRAGGLLARIGSPSSHPSKQTALSTFLG
ncbi:hypothetical protein J6590_064940 [Homalodisca vitripennis]|nr:hypothetical protein J6590_064940 [Homalodisca vitripennis]